MSNILIHIGYGKAGSTYLQKWFHSHPHIYFQPKQFAQGFIDAWELARFAQGAESAPENFVLSCEDISIWQGDMRIIGLRGTRPYDYRHYQNVMCDTLYGLFPTAKILIVSRGYSTIFKSIYAQYISMAGTFTFRELVEANPGMLTTFLDYSYVIDLYRKKFGSDKVIVLPYELLRDDSARFLELIEQQLNITEKYPFEHPKVNVAMDERELYVYRHAALTVFKFLQLWPKFLTIKMYLAYTRMVRRRKLHWLFRPLSRILNNPITMDGLEELLASMKGKAEVLRNEPLFQPYLEDYLL